MPQSLEDILRALKRGDASAMRPLYERTSARLYGIMMHYSDSSVQARDVLKRLYLDIWRMRASLPTEPENALNWLASQARRQALLLRNEPRRAQDTEQSKNLIDGLRQSPVWNGMPQKEKDLIVAAYVEGVSIETLAQMHDIEPLQILERLRQSIARLGRAQS